MKIITVAHQKGGVGKTTLALNLAFYLKDIKRVGIVDTDLQGSVQGLDTLLDGITLVSYEALQEGTYPELDIIIIDTPPYLTNRLNDLFSISDFVLVPTKVSYLDAMALKATMAMLQQSQQERADLKAGIVLNMVKPRTSMNREIKDILDAYPIPTLTTRIHERVSYIRSVVAGGIVQLEDTKAHEEMADLAEEIIDQL
ncbi:AAA family ATPase [Fibrella sp. WM1]|uniref:ParA family protein n=1 Tax=Spirosoma sordidisoli TaxID=2502893 RepID=A0A4Q2UCT6_9BACT|nr:ParA family protein [Spirosoma sordidisoli]RYC66684.1 ParA family protein [Spirosoma sordidisoli]